MRRVDHVISQLQQLCVPPSENPDDWLAGADECVEFMRSSAASKEVVLFASFPPHGLIHSWLMPLEGLDIDKARKADVRPSDTWSVEEDLHSAGLSIEPPRSMLTDACEQLLYRRNFLGSGESDYTEISQRLVHVLRIHLSRPGHWSHFDEHGDLQDVVYVKDDIDLVGSFKASAVIILAEAMHEYMALTRCALVRRFDFPRFDPQVPLDWDDAERKTAPDRDLYYETGVAAPRVASYAKGVQIIRPSVTAEQLAAKRRQSLLGEDREYEKFIAVDFTTNRRIEASCSPHRLSYPCRMDPDLPNAYSAAFFRSEVMARYKDDPQKYDLSYDGISCRDILIMRSIGRNEAGQIYVYLKDLGDLPIYEQQYWKAFNVEPEAGISGKSINRDFLGAWNEEYDALESLKQKVFELNQLNPRWWQRRDQRLITASGYPLTESEKEFGDELLHLHQLLVEGFSLFELRKIAEDLSRTPEQEWGSLKLVGVCLQGFGVSAHEVKAIISPLQTLNQLRIKLAAHSSSATRAEILARAIEEAGSFYGYFNTVVSACDEALAKIMEVMLQRCPNGS